MFEHTYLITAHWRSHQTWHVGHTNKLHSRGNDFLWRILLNRCLWKRVALPAAELGHYCNSEWRGICDRKMLLVSGPLLTHLGRSLLVKRVACQNVYTINQNFKAMMAKLFHTHSILNYLFIVLKYTDLTPDACSHVRGFLPYLSRVLESEWCLLVLRRAARCPLMGTVLIRSKCTLLLLWPGRAGPEGGEKEQEKGEGKRKDNNRQWEGKVQQHSAVAIMQRGQSRLLG